eukprot:TRINITY_DN12413_c0_g1_i1.p1 TRINITY_DN12413_c0_g1~~TRINITY_DN12413_c0_g1_i1.p1  ORF type:complete len:410 (-),score=34.37 TRINITY_DN12413_c0_g1_i1:210-1439(-)
MDFSSSCIAVPDIACLKRDILREMVPIVQDALTSALERFGNAIEEELKNVRDRLGQLDRIVSNVFPASRRIDAVCDYDFEVLVEGLQTKISVLRAELETLKGDRVAKGEEATAVREATSHGILRSKRNQDRKKRRRRTRDRVTIQRSLFLQMRPTGAVREDARPAFFDDTATVLATLSQRMDHLENLGAYSCQPLADGMLADEVAYETIVWDPTWHVVPGRLLARQCRGAFEIQRAWRRYRRRMEVLREENLGIDQRYETDFRSLTASAWDDIHSLFRKDRQNSLAQTTGSSFDPWLFLDACELGCIRATSSGNCHLVDTWTPFGDIVKKFARLRVSVKVWWRANRLSIEDVVNRLESFGNFEIEDGRTDNGFNTMWLRFGNSKAVADALKFGFLDIRGTRVNVTSWSV